jgi:hypothetical protein
VSESDDDEEDADKRSPPSFFIAASTIEHKQSALRFRTNKSRTRLQTKAEPKQLHARSVLSTRNTARFFTYLS